MYKLAEARARVVSRAFANVPLVRSDAEVEPEPDEFRVVPVNERFVPNVISWMAPLPADARPNSLLVVTWAPIAVID